MTEIEELRLAYAECSRQRNELLTAHKLRARAAPRLEPKDYNPERDRNLDNADAGLFAAPMPAPSEPMAWMPIETAPKDGSKILLAKHGWSCDMGDAAYGSAEWKQRLGDATRQKYSLWWCCSGSWSEKWGNWNDGTEPCGLAGPTHWMPLPAPPQEKP